MSDKRNNIIALVTASLFIGLGVLTAHATAQTAPSQAQSMPNKANSFTRDLAPALAHRAGHIVDLDTFCQMHTETNTIILDTRARKDFAKGHIYGAVNMPLSEMSLLNLSDVVDDRQTRILIYGDENIAEVSGHADYDVSTLPVNLLAFISLHRYGYSEIYELGEKASLKDARLNWDRETRLVASLQLADFK